MQRIEVNKTYKMYIGGKFPRTESGRSYPLKTKDDLIVNICLASRKDFKNAVVEARKSQPGWQKTTALHRGQILYRIAEMLEGRKNQFIEESVQLGATKHQAVKLTELTIDRLIYYAGWSDKYQQFFSTINPVASPYFNFSLCEPQGVVAIIAPEKQGLLGLISLLAPAIVGGNSVVLLVSQAEPFTAISFAEVLHSSDVPNGVVNILTGDRNELIPHFASHMDVNSIIYCGKNDKHIQSIEEMASINLKRTIIYKKEDWSHESCESPYFIEKTQEIKTTWHPNKA